jgi:hypothetical protein
MEKCGQPAEGNPESNPKTASGASAGAQPPADFSLFAQHAISVAPFFAHFAKAEMEIFV